MRRFSEENRQPRKALGSGSGKTAEGGGTQGQDPTAPARGRRDLLPGDEALGERSSWHPVWPLCPSRSLAGGQEGQGGCVSSSPACGAARQAEARHCPPPLQSPQGQGSKGKVGVPKLFASVWMVSRGGPVGGPSGWRAPQPPPKADFGRNPMGPG